MRSRVLDLAIVAAYLAVMVSVGIYFSRRQTSTERFFVAKRSLPSWVMGLSMLATMISSVTFVAYPGSSYAGNWSLLVPGLMLIAVLPVVGRVIIPFYREAVGMSAYEYFGQRFGTPARVYSALAFSVAHFSKMGFVLYLMALTLSSITGWNISLVIVSVAAVMILYAMLGGIEAVAWTDVVQGFVMAISILVVLMFLLFLPEGGPPAVLGLAMQSGKFHLGAMDWNFRANTIPVLALYGLFWYLQRYVADQTMVQRYLLAKTHAASFRGVRLGAFLSVPVWALFMLIGTCVWAFFLLAAEQPPPSISKSDQMFPYFLSRYMPPGFLGLLLASLMGSAMTMLASDLNSMSVVAVEDFYRQARPNSSDRERLFVARVFTAVTGLLNVATALVLVQSKGSALANWFAVSAIASGGLLGLFGLAFLTSSAQRAGIYCGMAATTVFSLWAALTKGSEPILDLGAWNFPYSELMIGVFGNLIMFLVGWLSSIALRRLSDKPASLGGTTLWQWLAYRKLAKEGVSG